METVRKPYQGVLNILVFNWPYFALSALGVVVLLIWSPHLSGYLQYVTQGLVLGIMGTILVSLCVSYYVYDLSPLYTLDWLDSNLQSKPNSIANIHAGFDETTEILRRKYPDAEFSLFDFYDPQLHTEASIKRARKKFPPNSRTKSISTSEIPLSDHSVDLTLVVLSAHEIRNCSERNKFFSELKRITKFQGKVIIVEHLRDIMNFIAYNIGFFHFQSRANWMKAFLSAGLKIQKEQKITPFITIFTLENHDCAP